MPVKTSRDPKTGKLTYKYEAPKGGFKKSKRLSPEDVGIKTPTKRYSEQQKEDRRSAQYNPGGVFENNPFRRGLEAFGLGGFVGGLDKLNADRQLRLLNENPDLRSSRFANVQKNIRDAAATGGFNFDNLFMGANVDRRDEDEVRVRPEEDYTNISGSIDSTDKENPYVAAAANYGNTALGQYIDPNRYNAFRTNKAYGTSNRPSGLLGGLYDVLGGTTVDEVMSTYPDNMPVPVVNNRPTGNFNNLPPTERSLSGGLLGTPTFNFDVSPFGGAGVYDKIMLDAIRNSPFGSGIGINSSLTPSVAKGGFLGLNPSGTINIGNIGTVTDPYGRELSGQERIDFINSEFNKLKNQNDALSNFNLGILR